MNFSQIGFVVRSGVSALVVAFLLNYSAHYEWGLSRQTIRFGGVVRRSDHWAARGHRPSFEQAQVVVARCHLTRLI
jgi:hypothetical protein